LHEHPLAIAIECAVSFVAKAGSPNSIVPQASLQDPRQQRPPPRAPIPLGDRVIWEIAVDRSRIMTSAVAVASLKSLFPTFGFGLLHRATISGESWPDAWKRHE
jgi:hypothetical protein